MLFKLIQVLKPVIAQWYELGIALGVTSDRLDTIRVDNPHSMKDCLRDLLHHWLQKYPERGWADIIEALRQMNMYTIAEDIERQYLHVPGTWAGTHTMYTRRGGSV